MKCALGLLALMTAAAPAFGGEYVLLSSGLKLRADRHEQSGSLIRLFYNGGVTELPAKLVSGFEEEELVPPEPAAAAIAPVVATQARDPKTLVRDAAKRSGLPPEFVESVAQVESGFRPGAISPKGALGVMQLMPETARTLGADPRDTAQNIDAGTRLLRELLIKYDGDVVKALAAYNAGQGAVDKYQGLPPYNETRWYVKKVIDAYQKAVGQ
ncbi:MAG TPA: lytic transglycosylase domain-containing protein [Bryobacteraceae bacterium]|nr:lytic transglycosylase domain-containing protein [Bryobacteraceae bacterium]